MSVPDCVPGIIVITVSIISILLGVRYDDGGDLASYIPARGAWCLLCSLLCSLVVIQVVFLLLFLLWIRQITLFLCPASNIEPIRYYYYCNHQAQYMLHACTDSGWFFLERAPSSTLPGASRIRIWQQQIKIWNEECRINK